MNSGPQWSGGWLGISKKLFSFSNATKNGNKVGTRETVPSQTSDMGKKPLSVLAHKVLPHKGLNQYMGGISQEGKRPTNWEFYSLRIGFS